MKRDDHLGLYPKLKAFVAAPALIFEYQIAGVELPTALLECVFAAAFPAFDFSIALLECVFVVAFLVAVAACLAAAAASASAATPSVGVEVPLGVAAGHNCYR